MVNSSVHLHTLAHWAGSCMAGGPSSSSYYSMGTGSFTAQENVSVPGWVNAKLTNRQDGELLVGLGVILEHFRRALTMCTEEDYGWLTGIHYQLGHDASEERNGGPATVERMDRLLSGAKLPWLRMPWLFWHLIPKRALANLHP